MTGETPMTFVHLMSHTSGLNAGQVGPSDGQRAQMRRADAASGLKPDSGFDADPRSGTLEDEMIKLAISWDSIRDRSVPISTNMLAYMVNVFRASLASICKGNILRLRHGSYRLVSRRLWDGSCSRYRRR